jgi:hypothetical protein
VPHAPAAPSGGRAAGFDTARRAVLTTSPGRVLSEGPGLWPESKPEGRMIPGLHEESGLALRAEAERPGAPSSVKGWRAWSFDKLGTRALMVARHERAFQGWARDRRVEWRGSNAHAPPRPAFDAFTAS